MRRKSVLFLWVTLILVLLYPRISFAKKFGDSFTFKGFGKSRFRTYPVDRNDLGLQRKDEQLFFEGEVELGLDLGKGFSAYLRPRIFIDALDTDLKRFEPYEGYFTYQQEFFDLRAGQFIENWGIVDTFSLVDHLNRRDLAPDFLDPNPLGELGVRGRVFFNGVDFLEEPSIAIYALPLFRKTPFPTQRSRFSFSNNNFWFRDDLAFTPQGGEKGFYALRFTGILNSSAANADFQVLFSGGPERFPLLMFQPLPVGPANLVPLYYGAWTVGGGISAVPNVEMLADLTFKLETVYKVPYQFNNTPFLFPPNQFPQDYFAYVVGLDYVFNDLLRTKDQLTLTIEYAGEVGANDPTSQIRPLRNDIIGRLFWQVHNFSRSSVEIRGIIDVTSAETILEGIIEHHLRFIHEDLKAFLKVQGFILNGNKQSIFNLFPNNTSITTGLQFDF